MAKIKIIISTVLIIVAISFAFFYQKKMDSKHDLLSYLPHLQNYNLQDIKFRKILADPSYTVPYDILISFRTDSKNIIADLGLESKAQIDTTLLKSDTWIEEYELYFTFSSINALRYKSMEDEKKKINWWDIEEGTNNYASPYIDTDGQKRIVRFGQKNNGRIVCCRSGNIYYILIECWG